MDDIYKNIEEYNPNKKRKNLIAFDDMIADVYYNEKPNKIVNELFIRGTKLNISFVFIKQSYFKVPKDVKLNTAHFFIMKIPQKFWKTKKRDEQQRENEIKALESRVEKNFLDTDQKSFASLFSKDFLNEEAKYEVNKDVEMENKLDRNDLIYKTGTKTKDKKYDFEKFKTITSFGREIYNNDLSLDDALEQKIILKNDVDISKESSKPKKQSQKKRKH